MCGCEYAVRLTQSPSLSNSLAHIRRVGALDDTFLFERQVALSDYLKSVLMVESVQSSVPLLSFLGGASIASVDKQTKHR